MRESKMAYRYRVVALLLAIAFVTESCSAQSKECPRVHRNEEAFARQLNQLINLSVQRLVNISHFVDMYEKNFTSEADKLSDRHQHVLREWWEIMNYILADSMKDRADEKNIQTSNCKGIFGLEFQVNKLEADVSACRSNRSALTCAVKNAISYRTYGYQLRRQASRANGDVDQLLSILQQLANYNRQAMQAFTHVLYEVLYYARSFGSCLIRADLKRTDEARQRICSRRSCLVTAFKKQSQSTKHQ